MKENRSKRIIKVAQQIKSNVDNGGKIWEIKRKIQRKNQTCLILPRIKKQQNQMFITDFRGMQEILLKSTENKTDRAEETQIQCKVE